MWFFRHVLSNLVPNLFAIDINHSIIITRSNIEDKAVSKRCVLWNWPVLFHRFVYHCSTVALLNFLRPDVIPIKISNSKFSSKHIQRSLRSAVETPLLSENPYLKQIACNVHRSCNYSSIWTRQVRFENWSVFYVNYSFPL